MTYLNTNAIQDSCIKEEKLSDEVREKLNRNFTKVSELENDANYVSVEIVQQMIIDAINDLCKWEEGDETPSVPDIPDTPDVPDVPEDTTFGSISDNNEILIDQTKLINDTYTLKYIDSNDAVIDNFDPITTFTVNN